MQGAISALRLGRNGWGLGRESKLVFGNQSPWDETVLLRDSRRKQVLFPSYEGGLVK